MGSQLSIIQSWHLYEEMVEEKMERSFEKKIRSCSNGECEIKDGREIGREIRREREGEEDS